MSDAFPITKQGLGCPPMVTTVAEAPSRGTSAFTLIELLVAITIITVLMALLLPALALVRRQAALASARQTVQQITLSLDTYRAGDAEHRYPPPQSDGLLALRAPTAGSSALLALLEQHRLPTLRARELDEWGRLIDPWGNPYRYALTRPLVSDPASLENWNYDQAQGRERAWGRRWDAGSGTIVAGVLPFPYVHSLGPEGKSNVAAGWIYNEDAQ